MNKELNNIELRASKIEDSVARYIQELTELSIAAEELRDELKTNRAEEVFNYVQRIERELASINFCPFRSKLNVDLSAKRLLENQLDFIKQKEALGKPTENAESCLNGMHALLDIVSTWRRDENGNYEIFTR